MSDGDRFPCPTSTRVPTIALTICLRNRSAVNVIRITDNSLRISKFRISQIGLVLSVGAPSKEEKLCWPLSLLAASFMETRLRG